MLILAMLYTVLALLTGQQTLHAFRNLMIIRIANPVYMPVPADTARSFDGLLA